MVRSDCRSGERDRTRRTTPHRERIGEFEKADETPIRIGLLVLVVAVVDDTEHNRISPSSSNPLRDAEHG